jgi:hypothetical protein
LEITEYTSHGHGVRFQHVDAPATVVAFAVGYEWLHNPGAPVTVEILNKAPEGVADALWTRILGETTSAVQAYFSGGPQLDADSDIGPVSVWYNA